MTLPLKLNRVKEKVNLYNKYVLSQCNPLLNDSKLPENQTYIIKIKLLFLDIEDEDIVKNS